jgi:spore maturation protein CgeB
MKIVFCGLSISSAWGNGHATLLRGLFKSLHRRGHEIHFFEHDVPYYASHRDASEFPYVHLHLYSDWDQASADVKAELRGCDIGVVTSYCPHGREASHLLLDANLPRSIFYDMDTPVTIDRLLRGEQIPYLPEGDLSAFDLVLSYTGGRALDELRNRLGAKIAAPLYGWVDADLYFPDHAVPRFDADLSYLGTFAADRQDGVDRLLLQPARLLPERTFVIGGAMYPGTESWPRNVRFFDHVPPPEHRGFYCSCSLTLNVTRGSMAAMGYCPSGRLFEAAACGTPILSDRWEGIDSFFEEGSEILLASSTDECVAGLRRDRQDLSAIGRRARERTLDCHTSEMRAERFLQLAECPELASSQALELEGAVQGEG